MTAGRIVLLVFGVIFVIVAIGLFLSGGFVLWADIAHTSDGFLSTGNIEVQRDTYAIATRPIDIHFGGPGDWRGFGEIRIRASNQKAGPVFIGIGEEDDVMAYLANVNYSEIRQFDLFPLKIEYEDHPGNATPRSPSDQDFWVASTQGTGEQSLVWELESGSFSAVLMNGDASKGIDMEVSVGAKVTFLLWIGIGLVVAGLIAAGIGGFMIFLAFRRT